MSLMTEWISGRVFQLVHQNNLVYNCCWEDPRLDRIALKLRSNDTIAMITSAGCNALDYALDGPSEIHAIDVNYRQNALLELKLAGIRTLDFEDFFAIFGRGRWRHFHHVYHSSLRHLLSVRSRAFWDKRTCYFTGEGRWGSFYYHGTSGLFARSLRSYIDRRPAVRQAVDDMFSSDSLETQSPLYYSIRDSFWNKLIRWIMQRDSTLALLGVPRAQRLQLEDQYPGGIVQFIEDCIESVFAKMPLQDNYFWRLYVYGEYSNNCCPEYLKFHNFMALKNGLVDSIRVYTCDLTEFLSEQRRSITRFVLLDHMDWLHSPSRIRFLQDEWQAMIDCSSIDTRYLWRSAGLNGRFIDSLSIRLDGKTQRLGDLLNYHLEQAAELHRRDRVHTYGSFCIADFVSP